ncbi:hypothetical protein P3T76_010466 [Phytophthora citrophthora]|uniref:Uncharacterized protein n=1 Tax=Phytophthora citrophthora TaxID=4793 RepID=A0AAD9GC25_9STRA|nr:hypothetical protein P3T76_010466 [Phytophthora citrophthora]
MFANHFVTIAPHAAVMVVSPKDSRVSSPTTKDSTKKYGRAKSERDARTDKKTQTEVRIVARRTC